MTQNLNNNCFDVHRAPELMAPAGDWDCARAAVENGADAIYFGLQDGFNARARALNFAAEELPELMAFLRGRGVKGYLALNTLVFPNELEEAERIVRAAIAAGIDAVLVQDIGLLRLIHQLCPELPLHASTQMTLSSAECIREVESLGVRRVVLPRELSIAEISEIHRQTAIELEAFVHGALCISFSGQCLASLSFGGRSANCGQCAQPCRLPYEAVCDGHRVELGDKKYLLSPHDLAAYDRLPELIAAGVAALKIEGRMKTAEYVAGATAFYRKAIDAAAAGGRVDADPIELAELEVAFSRGFGRGWLNGRDHKAIVFGRSSAKRGIALGTVAAIVGRRVSVQLTEPVRRGDGVVFECDRGEDAEQGGRVYEIFQQGKPVAEAAAGVVDLAFDYETINVGKLRTGQMIWKTHDPRLERRLRKTFSGPSQRTMPLDIVVEATVGTPLRITATAMTGATSCVESPEPLVEAVKHAITVEMLGQQLGRLGHTAYQLQHLDARIAGQPMIPLSVLGKLRREMVEQLDAATARPPLRATATASVLSQLREGQSGEEAPAAPSQQAQLHILCRSLEHVRIALECGAKSIVADLPDLADCGETVRIVRRGFAKIMLATPRIHLPNSSGALQRLAGFGPDGILVRNLAGLAFYRDRGIAAVADFSLNATNELAVGWLYARGAARVTAPYDLSHQQLLELAAAVRAEWLEVVIYRHTPMFHSAYCLFCALLSPGRGRSDCGQPCRRHELRLRDRVGIEHPLVVDSQCQNTLFHAHAQDVTESVPALVRHGIRHFRMEFLANEAPAKVLRIVTAARSILGG